MLPLTLLVAQKVSNLLTTDNALALQIEGMAAACNTLVPAIGTENVVLSSATPDIGDKNVQLTYPRVCVYSSTLKNTQLEKFRSLSGTISVVTEIWASGALVGDVDQWINFYVEAVTAILRANLGDWQDGVFFSGAYEVQFQPAKAGGLGFVESARVTTTLMVSRN